VIRQPIILNKLTMKFRILAALGFVTIGSLTLSCEEKKTVSSMEDPVVIVVDFDKERSDLRTDLLELELKIDKKLLDLEAKKEKADAQLLADISDTEAKLLKEKSDVEKALDRVENASEKTWLDTKNGINKMNNDIRQEWERFKVDLNKPFN